MLSISVLSPFLHFFLPEDTTPSIQAFQVDPGITNTTLSYFFSLLCLLHSQLIPPLGSPTNELKVLTPHDSKMVDQHIV